MTTDDIDQSKRTNSAGAAAAPPIKNRSRRGSLTRSARLEPAHKILRYLTTTEGDKPVKKPTGLDRLILVTPKRKRLQPAATPSVRKWPNPEACGTLKNPTSMMMDLIEIVSKAVDKEDHRLFIYGLLIEFNQQFQTLRFRSLAVTRMACGYGIVLEIDHKSPFPAIEFELTDLISADDDVWSLVKAHTPCVHKPQRRRTLMFILRRRDGLFSPRGDYTQQWSHNRVNNVQSPPPYCDNEPYVDERGDTVTIQCGF
jgi:hypothetical protein